MPRFHSCNVKMFLLNKARPPLKGGTEEPCHLGGKNPRCREPERLQEAREAALRGAVAAEASTPGLIRKAPHGA